MKLKTGFLGLFLLLSPDLFAAPEPSEQLKVIASKMVSFLEENKEQLESDEHLAKKIVRQELLPLVDVNGLGHRLLKRSVWDGLDEQQKQRFTRAFVDHIIETYSNGLKHYDGHRFVFLNTEFRNGGNTAYVYSDLIAQDNQTVKIIYTLKLFSEDNAWKVVDISIEGIKIIQNYREQLKSVDANEGVEALLAKLEEHKL